MIELVAYKITAAIESKLGYPIALRANCDVWEWASEHTSYAILKNTASPAGGVAQNVLDNIRRYAPPPNKKRKPSNDD